MLHFENNDKSFNTPVHLFDSSAPVHKKDKDYITCITLGIEIWERTLRDTSEFNVWMWDWVRFRYPKGRIYILDLFLR